MAYTPTDEQIAVLDSFRAGNNASVKAYAGAGKTSTLVQAAATQPGKRVIFTAFNKKIIQDSARKFGPNVRCQTTHSLATHVAHADGGWRWGRMRAPRIYGRKLAQLLAVNDPIPLDGGRVVHPSRLASLALMMVDRFANSGDDDLAWWHLPSVPGLDDRDTRRLIGEAMVPAARRAWANVTNPEGALRYTHNYYRKEFALSHPRIECDAIMVDEAQDSAGVLVRLIQDQAEHGTQIITVGDSYQAINGWTGAVDAMDKFGGDQLFITQSFRFGSAIAAEANKWLEIMGADKPLRGFDQVPSRVITGLATPDAVLCRTNGAVVKEVIDRLTKGEKVAMLGDPSEIINFTRGATDLMDKGWSGHHDLMAFGSWAQVQEYVEHDDAGADLKVLVDLIDKHGADVIEDAMGRLTPATRADVVLSTAHKCKGAEWDAVRIGGDFKAPPPDEITKRIVVSREAAMLNYVAVTRAKLALDLGSLSWVDEALADHRAAKGERRNFGGGEQVPFGPEDDPDVIVRVDLDAYAKNLTAPPKPGDHIGPRVVVETDRGQLATIMPLDLDTHHQHLPQVQAMLVDAARTPVALPGPEPEWVTQGMPGPDWTEQDVADMHAAAAAHFTEGLRVAQHGTDDEKAKMFGHPIPERVQRTINAAAVGGLDMAEVVLAAPDADAQARLLSEAAPLGPAAEELEAPIDALIAETAPVAPKVLTEDDIVALSMEWGEDPKRPGSCGAKHKSWMNTYCLLDPHGPEHLHRVKGISWDDAKCSELGVTPAHA